MEHTPRPQETIGLDALKVLVHPRRQRIVAHLTTHGPATSATLARALGLNTGATSYHLRELSQHGFVQEVPELATGRQRWWKAVSRDVRFPKRSEQSEQERVVIDEINRDTFADDIAQFTKSMMGGHASSEWDDAMPFSRSAIRLTSTELSELFEEYIALINRYRSTKDDEDRPGVRTVFTRFFAFPAPDPEDP